jgi:hypothetical protein
MTVPGATARLKLAGRAALRQGSSGTTSTSGLQASDSGDLDVCSWLVDDHDDLIAGTTSRGWAVELADRAALRSERRGLVSS